MQGSFVYILRDSLTHNSEWLLALKNKQNYFWSEKAIFCH